MSDTRTWMEQLQAEIARELGQPITLAEGGEAPEPAESVCDALTLPAARLVLTAASEDVAAFLVEARVVETGQVDAEMVRELWSGILASVAAGLGGKASPAGVEEGAAATWALGLGNARVRLALRVEPATAQPEGKREEQKPETEARPAATPAPPPAARAETGPGVGSGTGFDRPAGNFDLLLEVELDAAVRFGSREMELKELLELGPGDVVELDRQVADPVDLIVGDRIVARGEVVLVNGNFGLRVTEVAAPVRRLESIRWLW
jgi:flagellar motor switch protein FliN